MQCSSSAVADVVGVVADRRTSSVTQMVDMMRNMNVRMYHATRELATNLDSRPVALLGINNGSVTHLYYLIHFFPFLHLFNNKNPSHGHRSGQLILMTVSDVALFGVRRPKKHGLKKSSPTYNVKISPPPATSLVQNICAPY